jgi:hypothetical protein
MLLFGLSELTLSHQCVVGFCFRCAFRLRGYWTTGRPPSASFFSCFTRAPPVGCSLNGFPPQAGPPIYRVPPLTAGSALAGQ